MRAKHQNPWILAGVGAILLLAIPFVVHFQQVLWLFSLGSGGCFLASLVLWIGSRRLRDEYDLGSLNELIEGESMAPENLAEVEAAEEELRIAGRDAAWVCPVCSSIVNQRYKVCPRCSNR